MCGFVGLIENTTSSRKDYRPILDNSVLQIKHRGPDSQKTYSENGIHLGHARLSIIDLSPTGEQPMFDFQNENIIVFNGEIYNYEELYKKYCPKDGTVNGDSDTAVLLYMFKKFGKNCLDYLNGMFAFAIINIKSRDIFIARDRFGEKPLYWIIGDFGIAFSSELKALKTLINDRTWEIDMDSHFLFLTNGYVPAPKTIFKNVHALSAGTWAIKQGERVEQGAYWTLGKTYASKRKELSKLNYQEVIEQTKPRLLNAIKSRLVSDVEVGLFLSGGIDSGTILGASQEVGSQIQKAIIIDFEEKGYSEYKSAKITANYYNNELQRITVNENGFEETLDDFFNFMDQPTVDGFNTFFVSKAAKQVGLKVWLSGVGGDELFGGYPSFKNFGKRKKMSSIVGGLVPDFFLEKMNGKIGSNNFKLSRLFHLLLSSNKEIRTYRSLRSAIPFYNADTLSSVNQKNDLSLIDNFYKGYSKDYDDFQLSSFFETNLYMRHLLLRDIDNFSMAHSLEIRAPFLDYELFDFVFSLPQAMKQNGKRVKPLLVDCLNNKLPVAITDQPKKGFTFPVDKWTKQAIQPIIESTIFDPYTIDFWNKDYLKKVWSLFLEGKMNWNVIWTIFVFNKWYKNF